MLKITFSLSVLLFTFLGAHGLRAQVAPISNEDSLAAMEIQQRAIGQFRIGKFEYGITILDSALAIFTEQEWYDLIASAELDRIRAQMYLNHDLLELHQARLRLEKNILPLVEKRLIHAKAYQAVGESYRDLGQLQKSVEYFSRSLDVLSELDDVSPYYYGLVHSWLARVYQEMHQKALSLEHRREAVRYQRALDSGATPSIILDLAALLSAQLALSDSVSEESYALLDEIRHLSENLDEREHKYLTTALLAEFSVLQKENRHHEVLALLPEIERYDLVEGTEQIIAIAMLRRGRAYSAVGRDREALALWDSVYAECVLNSSKWALAHNISELYADGGMGYQALEWAQRAEAHILPDSLELKLNPYAWSLDAPKVLQTLRVCVKALSVIAYSSGIEKDHKSIIDKIDSYDSFFRLAKTRAVPGELMTLREAGWLDIYDFGMQAAYRAYQLSGEASYLSTAWEMTEESKAATLLSSFNRIAGDELSPVSSELLQEESALRTEYGYLQSLLMQEDLEEAEKAPIRKRFFEVNRHLDKVVERYKNEYADYSAQRFSPPLPSLEEARDELDSDEFIWNYFSGPSGVYTLSLGAESCDLRRLSSEDSLSALVSEYRTRSALMPSLQNFREEMSELNAMSFELYKHVVIPVLPATGKLPEKVVVLPDGVLHYLPFEALVTVANSGLGNERYLIEDTEISYAYGYRSIEAYSPRQVRFDGEFMGLAPAFGSSGASTSWSQLRGAQVELDRVASLFNEASVSKDLNCMDWFRGRAGQYRIMHFSTHAFTDPIDPLRSGLLLNAGSESLQDGTLKVSDLYFSSLPAEMVVLSACQTGDGPIRRGEGAISLAHGFFYAGSPAVLMTLWPSNDASGADLMSNFYKVLLEGNTKRAALSTAKRSYLASHDGYMKHPYFWAGMVLVGDPRPLYSSDSLWSSIWLWLLIALIMAIVLLILPWRPSQGFGDHSKQS